MGKNITIDLDTYNEMVAKITRYEDAVRVAHTVNEWREDVSDYIELTVDLKPFIPVINEKIRDEVPISVQAKFDERCGERFRKGRYQDTISTVLFSESRKKELVEVDNV